MKEKNIAISVLERMNYHLDILNNQMYNVSDEEISEVKANLILDTEELVDNIKKMEEIVNKVNQNNENKTLEKENIKEEIIREEKTNSLKNLKILFSIIIILIFSVVGIMIYKNVPKIEEVEEIEIADPNSFRITENDTTDEDKPFEKIEDIEDTNFEKIIEDTIKDKKHEEVNLEKNISEAEVSNLDENRVEKDHEELDRAIAELENRSHVNEVLGKKNSVEGLTFIRKSKENDDKKKEITRNRYKLNEEVENKVENIIDRKNKIASSFNDYLVQQGSVIPAIFLTEVNTDLPGSVLAQVRENVYDSRTGNYLLIPKGSKLYGRYESNVSKGQTRVFMVWDKLSLPNGKYIELSEFHAGDNLGNSGVSDKTNNHTWSLIGNAVLSSVLNFTDTLASGVSFNLGGLKIGLNGQSKDGKDTSPFKEVTSHLVKKEVERQPTITIRRGYKFNIIVNGDMELEKYKY
ncbi:TrbI/VirB10 family protein [Streptobacillus moniliformis]|uniref:TrbI/VirB10 family protein n=1 Tax=Streptobacillus moniliformis TaxID=34105 RepID=UPI0007E47F6A|nr:TrbI/VirB10 family protein [Streptobacillus moniliformis]